MRHCRSCLLLAGTTRSQSSLIAVVGRPADHTRRNVVGFGVELTVTINREARELIETYLHHALAQRLIVRARTLYAQEPSVLELDASVYALDSTTIDRKSVV